MKSTYLLATLVGFFMFNTTVNASGSEAFVEDRITVIAREFEASHDRAQAKKNRERMKQEAFAAERKVAMAAIEEEKNRKEKAAKAIKSQPTSPKTPISKGGAAVK